MSLVSQASERHNVETHFLFCTHTLSPRSSDKWDSYPAGKTSHELKAMHTSGHPHRVPQTQTIVYRTQYHVSCPERVVDVTVIILMREETQTLAFSLSLPYLNSSFIRPSSLEVSDHYKAHASCFK